MPICGLSGDNSYVVVYVRFVLRGLRFVLLCLRCDFSSNTADKSRADATETKRQFGGGHICYRSVYG